MADFEGAREIRFLFPQDEEGEGDHAVGEAAAEVAGIDDPDEHLAAGERRDDGEEADEVEGVDGRLVFRMELREEARHHVGLGHGVEGAAAAHEEGVPARDDAAHAADDDDFCHGGGGEGFGHGIRGDEAGAVFGGEDLAAREDEADGDDDEGVEEDGADDGEDEDFADFLERDVDFLGGLRDDVEADEVEGRRDGDGEDGFERGHGVAGEE